jgi:hypothetical protein
MGGELRMDPSLMRGGLYAGLYRADYSHIDGTLGDQPVDFTADVKGSETPSAQQYIWSHEFADCVVRADQADARKLVLAPVASSIERQAFAALTPRFNGCMSAGQTLTFSRIVLTALISEALYREAKSSSKPSIPLKGDGK